MKFWDSSAIVALLVTEDNTTDRATLLESDPQMVVWWSTRVECASALNRLRREGGVDEAELAQALKDLDQLAAAWWEVAPTQEVRARAIRLLRIHPLRTADALQIAAALVAAGENIDAFTLVTDGARLREAAGREGFVTE